MMKTLETIFGDLDLSPCGPELVRCGAGKILARGIYNRCRPLGVWYSPDGLRMRNDPIGIVPFLRRK